tara:strand:- start:14563 stop:15321 length:759 start_codon:yes stop_codon:yes gene_type:complete
MTSKKNGTVTYSCKNKIGTVEFYHPKGNSLPGYLLKDICDAIKKGGLDPECRVIIFKSSGDGAFCAGASFDEFKKISNADEGKTFFMGFANVINAIRTCPKMIITRVHGKAIGGGVGLAAASDFCIAVKGASVRLSELAIGIGPFVVGPAVGRKIGVAAFSTLSIDATTWHDAEWAYSKGLYNKLAANSDELDTMVSNLANELSNSNPEAINSLKEIIWQGTGHWDATLEQRAEISGKLVLSDYTKKYIRKK